MSHVYAIRSDTGLVKIGMTMAEPEARMASLQTGNPHKLTMFTSFQVSDYGIDPAAFEAAMHRRLAPCRVVGEWFSAPDWLVIKVFQITAAEFHQPSLYARWERRFGRYCRMWLRKVTHDYNPITTLLLRDDQETKSSVKVRDAGLSGSRCIPQPLDTKLERAPVQKQVESDDNSKLVIRSNPSKHATVTGTPGQIVTVKIAPESDLETITVNDVNGTRIVKRNADRHKPGYQAQKQREYRAKKKAGK